MIANFEPNFYDGFKLLFNLYKDTITNYVTEWKNLRDGLKNDRDFNDVFVRLMEITISRGWNLEGKLNSFKKKCDVSAWNPDFFRSFQGKKILKDNDIYDPISEILNQLRNQSLNEWTEERHKHVERNEIDKNLEKIKGLGAKGRDNYLRDVGYFDRAPIDIHERRFLVRTGIFHLCSGEPFDPMDYNCLEKTLSTFCKKYLHGMRVVNIDLGRSPGIADAIIWQHCRKKENSICGKDPDCHNCPLAEQSACLLGSKVTGKKIVFNFKEILEKDRCDTV